MQKKIKIAKVINQKRVFEPSCECLSVVCAGSWLVGPMFMDHDIDKSSCNGLNRKFIHPSTIYYVD